MAAPSTAVPTEGFPSSGQSPTPAGPLPPQGAAVQAALRRLARRGNPDWLAAEIARRMAERLPLIRLQPAVVLDWWALHGASASELRAAYPLARYQAVEPTETLQAWHAEQVPPSAASGRSAWQRWWRWWRWLSREEPDGPAAQAVDAAACLPEEVRPGAADLLWANAMLQAEPDPPALLRRWHRALREGGFLMVSTLGPNTVAELRTLYREAGWGPPAQDFLDMHDLGDLLVGAGFQDPVVDQETLSLTWSSPERLLADLRLLGGNAHPGRLPGCRTPRWRHRLMQRLSEALDDGGGRLVLSVEVIYGHAVRGETRVAVEPVTTVSVDDMRRMMRSRR